MPRGRLLGAFLTTFDPPDPGVLIEHYLPTWLDLEHSFSEDGADRLRYFAELEDALRRLKNGITIVSSPGEVATSAEAWIWGYIRRLEVGAEGAAVQHSKLWLFHRASATKGKADTLEIFISSANLTRDGMRGQIQAGWRCVLPLERRESNTRLAGWGVLPTFLEELGASTGTSGKQTVQEWRAILRRCEPPQGVEFIASVPGTHSAGTLRRRQSAWGVAGLRACWSGRSSPSVTAMVPTIGRWTAKDINAWAQFAGVNPNNVSVAWVRDSHPWAGRWKLDRPTCSALTKCGIDWREVPIPIGDDWNSPLCDEHLPADPRWSHSKLYVLRQGIRRRVLVTSANFSRSAWGDVRQDGGLDIANFELGVLIKSDEMLSENLISTGFPPATSDIERTRPSTPPISWIHAEWSGKMLFIECRTRVGSTLAPSIDVTIATAKSTRSVEALWVSGRLASVRIPWSERDGVPLLISVTASGGHTRQVAVFNARPVKSSEILCGEFDAARLREARVALLEERYGNVPVDLDEEGVRRSNGENDSSSASGADYSVPAYVDSRRRFQLIDNWWKILSDADERSQELILDDGIRILERWRAIAKSAPGSGLRLSAKIAADELNKRLRSLR